MYSCSICPGKVFKSISEVNRHIESRSHKKRELMPDPNVLAAKRQREQDEKLAAPVPSSVLEQAVPKVSRKKKLKTKLESQKRKLKSQV